MTTIPDEGVEVLLEYDAALRFTERRFYNPDTRIILANVPTGFGVDFQNILAMGVPAHHFIVQGSSLSGRTDVMYKPSRRGLPN